MMSRAAGLLVLTLGLGGCNFSVTAPQAQAPATAAPAAPAPSANAALAAPEGGSETARVELGGPEAVVDPGAGPVDGDTSANAGSAQRAAIMEATRPTIERALQGPVEFVVQRVAVQDGWALLIADPQRSGGGRIDPNVVEGAEFRDGLTVNAILRFRGGAWTLVDHAIGPTDVWYCGVEGPPRSLTGC